MHVRGNVNLYGVIIQSKFDIIVIVVVVSVLGVVKS